MKKLIFSVVLTLCLVLISCGSTNINTNDDNLGLDLSKINTGEVVFNVYHSNTEGHIWEQIASFTIEPKNGKYYNVSLNGDDERIVISVEENSISKDKNSASYDTKILGGTENFIDEFEGNIAGYKTFEVENISGEQLYKLFPINNDAGDNYFTDVALDKPYDTEGVNLDNILITVEIK